MDKLIFHMEFWKKDSMRKILILPFVLLITILVACGSDVQTPTSKRIRTLAPTLAGSPISTCQKISIKPTPDAKEASLFPAVNEKDYVKGPKDAPMTIIEYGDFQ
jgi:hypothetical protein